MRDGAMDMDRVAPPAAGVEHQGAVLLVGDDADVDPHLVAQVRVMRLFEVDQQLDGAVLDFGQDGADRAGQHLAVLLDAHRLAGTRIHLLSRDGRDMLEHVANDPNASNRSATHFSGAAVSTFALHPTTWRLAVVTSRRAIYLQALKDSSVFGVIALLLVMSVGLLSALHRSLRVLSALSVRDPLTGLYNRRHFAELTRVELAKARRGSLTVGLAMKSRQRSHVPSSGDRAEPAKRPR